MPESSVPLSQNLPPSGATGQLAALDVWLRQEASGWLKKAGNQQGLLAEARTNGWQLYNWGKTTFGQLPGAGSARLLVYLPAEAAAKNNLAALLAAVRAWQAVENLPLTLKFLQGPLDEKILVEHAEELAADAIVYAEGGYQGGHPILSLGVKGLLEVELRVRTLAKDAPGAFSEIMPGASWLLVQAIAALKSESQEVQIEGFEEGLSSLPLEESAALRKAAPEFAPELAGRLREYGLDEYIFGLNDRLVLQTQYMVPTVNVSALECGHFGNSGRLKLPATARARLDFLLVPFQEPDKVFEKLYGHLLSKEFGPQLEIVKLPGSLRPSRTPLSARFVQATLAAGEALPKPPLVTPVTLFAGPLAALKETLGNPPAVCFGLDGSANRRDFTTHARWLAHLFPLVQGGDAAMFEIYPDHAQGPERKTLTAPLENTVPDLSNLDDLIPDFPELDL